MRSDQAAQGFLQAGLENLKGWRLRSLSEQPVSLLPVFMVKKISSYISSEPLLFQLTPSHLPATHHGEELGSIFFTASS